MAKGAKLKDALDKQKGVDHKLEKQKKFQKQALKRKRTRTEEVDEETEGVALPEEKLVNGSESKRSKRQKKTAPIAADAESSDEAGSEDWETDEEGGIDLSRLQDSDSDSDSEDNEDVDMENTAEDEEDEDEEDIPLSDLESLAEEDKGDVIPHQRLTINNTAALTKAWRSIILPSSLPFSATQAITSSAPTEIKDVEDDLSRELAFYKQSLEAVTQARTLLKKEGIPMQRPLDYFAEMVKSDEHMSKIKKKLVDDAAGKKAASEARRQRDLKKFGKQVQVAKLQERDKAKRETLDKIKMLKKSEFTTLSFPFLKERILT